MRPAIATVVGPGWETRLVNHARTTGLARLVGRCCDPAGLADIARRADVVFIGSDVHWLGETDLRALGATTRLIGVAGDVPGARLLDTMGVPDVIDASMSPAGMLAVAVANGHSDPGRIVEVTGARGAPGRSEVALGLAYAAAVTQSVSLLELDHAGPSLGIRMALPPSSHPTLHRTDGPSLMPLPVGVDPLPTGAVVGLVARATQQHAVTVLDGGPASTWHRLVDVDEVVFVGEATDVGVVRLARLCQAWLGPTPSLIINRHRPGQDLGRVRRATGLEPSAVIPELPSSPHRHMQPLLRPLAVQRTAL